MTRRALVLGAGGHAAIAWEIGVLAGLADSGVDLRNADRIVGTSAGAIVGAQLTSGLPLDALFQRQVDPRLQVSEVAPPVDMRAWRAAILAAKEPAGDVAGFLRRVGSLGATTSTVSVSQRREVVASRLPAHTWPDRDLVVVAVDADAGERRGFTRGDGVALVDAVMASGAVAGVWPVVAIAGRRFIDGGFYSTDNADLAADCDRVLILTLRAGAPPLRAVSLEAALDVLNRRGARTLVMHPDEAADAAFGSVGGNVLDPAVRDRAARAGREQGRRIATEVSAFWA